MSYCNPPEDGAYIVHDIHFDGETLGDSGNGGAAILVTNIVTNEDSTNYIRMWTNSSFGKRRILDSWKRQRS